ncbi:MAG: hypothetical protein IPG76_06725 [Acidobacteria bacterium]|nr:hypothetical protein [Acidobacteriota bacterium]
MAQTDKLYTGILPRFLRALLFKREDRLALSALAVLFALMLAGSWQR